MGFFTQREVSQKEYETKWIVARMKSISTIWVQNFVSLKWLFSTKSFPSFSLSRWVRQQSADARTTATAVAVDVVVVAVVVVAVVVAEVAVVVAAAATAVAIAVVFVVVAEVAVVVVVAEVAVVVQATIRSRVFTHVRDLFVFVRLWLTLHATAEAAAERILTLSGRNILGLNFLDSFPV